MIYKTRAISLAVATALITSACVAPPEQPSPSAPLAELKEEARAAEAAGEHEAAARTYNQLAEAAPAQERARYLLSAIRTHIKGNYLDEAQRTLERLSEVPTSTQEKQARQLLEARIVLTKRRPQEALERVEDLAPDTLPPPLQEQLYRLTAQAYDQLGNHLEVARARVRLHRLLTDPQAQRDNEKALWQTVTALSPTALEGLRTAPPPDPLSGWLELAHIAATRDAEELKEQISQWHQRYPQHPASQPLLEALQSRPEQVARRPQQIALLLPLTGPYAKPAAAARDGFLAAYFANQEADYRPLIRIYDTGAESTNVSQAYEQAVSDGAQFVVGPLDKAGVKALADNGQPPVPTLALNYVSDAPRAQFYQFGLSPEEEAQQVAERAWLEGHNEALSLVPADAWGERVLGAFKDRWQALGGKLLETKAYDPQGNDFSQPLRALLNIDAGHARHAQLENVLKRDLEFQPRRRQDVDFIFMAAFPRAARLLKPQLEFFFASDVPVYATSHVYSGTTNPDADQDMNNILFCDMPWVLSANRYPLWQQVNQAWPELGQRQRRLYALGVDAFRLIPELRHLGDYSFDRLRGTTGELYLDEHNKVHRELQWAQFKGGVPRRLQSERDPR